MKIGLACLLALSLVLSNAMAQTQQKKKTVASAQSQREVPPVDHSVALANLKTELDSVKQRIAASEIEDQKYAGGLIKAQIQSRIAVLRLTEALLTQKVAVLMTGARLNIEAPATKPDVVLAASLESEAAAQKLRIEQARVDADRYTGGLIKATRESTIATMESTLAMLEQRALMAKYGLAAAPVGTPARQMQTTPTTGALAKIQAHDEVLNVKLLDKKFVEQKYEKMVILDIEFEARQLKKPSRAIKGTLNINDLFGAKQMGVGWTIDRPMNPGERLVESGQGFKYNQFMDRHQWVRNTERDNMTVSYTVESILYEDGTREDF